MPSGAGVFDLNTLCMDGEIFESGKKKLQIQKYANTCVRSLRKHFSVCNVQNSEILIYLVFKL